MGKPQRGQRERRKSSLTNSQAELLERMQRMRFGRIYRLRVRGGEPVLDEPLAGVRTVKLGGRHGPPPPLPTGDFVLKDEYVEFFDNLRELGDGLVEVVVVQNGLPTQIEVADRSVA